MRRYDKRDEISTLNEYSMTKPLRNSAPSAFSALR